VRVWHAKGAEKSSGEEKQQEGNRKIRAATPAVRGSGEFLQQFQVEGSNRRELETETRYFTSPGFRG
jgi:hypothetical protein